MTKKEIKNVSGQQVIISRENKKVSAKHGKERDGIYQKVGVEFPKSLDIDDQKQTKIMLDAIAIDVLETYLNPIEQGIDNISKRHSIVFDPWHTLEDLIGEEFHNCYQGSEAIKVNFLWKLGSIAHHMRQAIDENEPYLAAAYALNILLLHKGQVDSDNELALLIGRENLKGTLKEKQYTEEQKDEWKKIYDSLDKEGKSRTWVRDRIVKKAIFSEKQSSPKRAVYEYIKNTLEEK